MHPEVSLAKTKTLNREFWDGFGSKFWEREAVVFDAVIGAPPISSERLFEIVTTAYGDSKLRATVPALAYLNREQQHGLNAERLFPRSSDMSFAGHSQRLKSTIGDLDFCFLVTHIESLDDSLWRWSRDFLNGLYESVGMNTLGVFYALFFGTYRRTPFGVHRDPESVFHFPVEGTKQIRVWPAGAVDPNSSIVHSTEYEQYLDQSTLLETRPGGFIYWPSNRWHTGEGDGKLTVSLALSMFCFERLDVALAAQLARSLAKQQGDLKQPVRERRQIPFSPIDLQHTAEIVPTEITQAAAQLRHQLSDEALTLGWLEICSASGFLTPPQLRPDEEIGLNDRFSSVPGDVPLYKRFHPGLAAVAANGHVIMTTCPDVEGMVSLLRSHSSHTAGSLVQVLCGSDQTLTQQRSALAVVRHLFRTRALNRC